MYCGDCSNGNFIIIFFFFSFFNFAQTEIHQRVKKALVKEKQQKHLFSSQNKLLDVKVEKTTKSSKGMSGMLNDIEHVIEHTHTALIYYYTCTWGLSIVSFPSTPTPLLDL